MGDIVFFPYDPKEREDLRENYISIDSSGKMVLEDVKGINLELQFLFKFTALKDEDEDMDREQYKKQFMALHTKLAQAANTFGDKNVDAVKGLINQIAEAVVKANDKVTS